MKPGLLLSILAAGSLVSCAGSPIAPEAPPFWPAPPEPARVRWVQQLATDADLGTPPSLLDRIRRIFTGVPSRPLLTKPFGICAGGGRVYVTDPSEGHVVVFDLNQRKREFFGETGPYRLARPYGIARASDGRLFVADLGHQRVVIISPNGEIQQAYGEKGVLVNPVGVALDEGRGVIYVSDSYRHHVLAFDMEGRVVRILGRQGQPPDPLPPGKRGHDQWWNRGKESGEFVYPSHLTVDPEGRLFVVDSMNFRIQVFGADGSFLRSFGGLGRQFGNFARPKGLTIDRGGNVFVADAAFNNIQIFNPQGDLLLFFGQHGRGPGEFWLPAGLASDGERVYVVDQYNRRVQIFDVLTGVSS